MTILGKETIGYKDMQEKNNKNRWYLCCNFVIMWLLGVEFIISTKIIKISTSYIVMLFDIGKTTLLKSNKYLTHITHICI